MAVGIARKSLSHYWLLQPIPRQIGAKEAQVLQTGFWYPVLLPLADTLRGALAQLCHGGGPAKQFDKVSRLHAEIKACFPP